MTGCVTSNRNNKAYTIVLKGEYKNINNMNRAGIQNIYQEWITVGLVGFWKGKQKRKRSGLKAWKYIDKMKTYIGKGRNEIIHKKGKKPREWNRIICERERYDLSLKKKFSVCGKTA